MLLSRRLRSLALRAGLFLFDHRWILIAVALGAIGLAGTFTALPAAVVLISTATATLILAIDVTGYVKRRRDIVFAPIVSETFDELRKGLDTGRFEVIDTETGPFVLDIAVSAALSSGSLTANLRREEFSIPPHLQEFGTYFQRRRAARVDYYNGNTVGLTTGLGNGAAPPRHLEFCPARYSDHLATDIFAMHDVLVARRVRSGFGQNLVLDRHGLPRDFGSSWLLNAVGASVIAFTTDGKVVVVQQSERNESSGGLFAPSGSGSLEPADFVDYASQNLSDVIGRGSLREMFEETGLGRADVETHEALGFGRWMRKAGKPEAFTLALLSVSSHTVEARTVRAHERPFSLVTNTLRINPQVLSVEHGTLGSLVLGHEFRGRISLPLAIGLTLAIRRAQVNDPLGDRLRLMIEDAP